MRIFSADSHVLEPPDLWTRKWSASAAEPPTLLRDSDHDWFVCAGVPRRSLASAFAAGRKEQKGPARYDEAPPAMWSAKERLKEQEKDGLSGEMLFPTLGLVVLGSPKAEVRREAARIYNDYLAEFVANYPRRLMGAALIDVGSVQDAVQEIHRTARMGLRGAVLPACPPSGSYTEEDYFPLWRAIADVDGVAHFHRGAVKIDVALDPVRAWKEYVTIAAEIQVTLAEMCLADLWQTFPLKVVCHEYGLGWLPYFVQRLSYAARRLGNDKALEKLRQQLAFTFQSPEELKSVLEVVGPEALMWASDYPHAESTFPHSQQVIARITKMVGSEQTAQLVGGNALAVYGFL